MVLIILFPLAIEVDAESVEDMLEPNESFEQEIKIQFKSIPFDHL